MYNELLAQIPLRRVNTPDEIAGAAVFLLSATWPAASPASPSTSTAAKPSTRSLLKMGHSPHDPPSSRPYVGAPETRPEESAMPKVSKSSAETQQDIRIGHVSD